jgi:hypothetical protein
MRQRARTAIITAALLLLSVACASDAEPPAGPRASEETEVQVLAASDCPALPCEGWLDPGTYRVTFFEPMLEFEVAASGWTWDYSTPLTNGGNFRLIADESHELPYNSDGIYFLLDPGVASRTCEEKAEAGVGRSVEDLVGWLEQAPGLVVSKPEPVMVGGLDGVQVDIELDRGWKKDCFFSEGMPTVPLLIHRADIGAYHWTILPGMSMRWYILATDDGVLIADIEDGPDGLSHTDVLEEGTKIVETFTFSSS